MGYTDKKNKETTLPKASNPQIQPQKRTNILKISVYGHFSLKWKNYFKKNATFI